MAHRHRLLPQGHRARTGSHRRDLDRARAPAWPGRSDQRFGVRGASVRRAPGVPGRMRDAGYLVAAGPLGDSQGEGMTILRLPGAGGLEQANKLATENDVSVASGLFTVTVRSEESR